MAPISRRGRPRPYSEVAESNMKHLGMFASVASLVSLSVRRTPCDDDGRERIPPGHPSRWGRHSCPHFRVVGGVEGRFGKEKTVSKSCLLMI